MSEYRNLYLDLLKRCLAGSVYKESAWAIVAPGNVLKRWLVQELADRSYLIVKRQEYREEVREEGKDWPLIGYTMIGHRRLDNIQKCVEDVVRNGVPGDFIETGVWRGGAVIFMRALLKCFDISDRVVWAADSFEGLPKPKTELYGDRAGIDLSDRSLLSVSLEEVKENFARFGLLDDQVKFLKGWFCDTLQSAPIERLALLRLDGDLYESTVDALNGLYHRVSVGGYVIIDDYHSWNSCKEAVNDFRKQHKIEEEIKPVDSHSVYWQVTKVASGLADGK